MGRPMPSPGEPLFTEDDTAAVIALAEEERDTCPSCGFLKAVCRSRDYSYADFEVREETCQVTYRLALRQDAAEVKARHEPTKRATQMSVVFREGREAPFDVGLDLASEQGDEGDE